MSKTSILCAIALFGMGFGGGILSRSAEAQRAPIENADPAPDHDQGVENMSVENMRKMFGNETAEFAAQFESMTIRVKETPFNAWAAPDGRFVLRLSGSDETIASDLWYPDRPGRPRDRVRHYSFSSEGRTWSCDFGRTGDREKLNFVHFWFDDGSGGTITYIDSDCDGRWDRMIDETGEHPIFYDRDGLCWKERAKEPNQGG